MAPMGYKPSLLNTFCAVMIGYLANLAFPRLGEVLKCTILGKYEKVPPDKLIGTILVERAVDVVSLAIVFVIALISQADVSGTMHSKQLMINSWQAQKVLLLSNFSCSLQLLLLFGWL